MAFQRATRAPSADLVATVLSALAEPHPDYPPQLFFRDSWHYSAPVFADDGWSNPAQTASRPVGVERTVWGRYLVVINGHDRSVFRGWPAVVLSWSHASPLGPETCVIRFPMISPFERLGVDIPWLHDQAKLHLRHLRGDGTVDPDWHWCGIKHSSRKSWTPDGWATDVEFKGFLFQGDEANNRPKAPHGGQYAHDIGNRIPARFNNIIGRKFKAIAHRITGIEVSKKGALTDSVVAFATELLSIAWTDDGLQWALMDRPHGWQAHMVLPDPDTVDYTLALGTEGVEFELDDDNSEQINVVYAEWITPDGARTQNLKYPNLLIDDGPGFPLGLGAHFAPGDAQDGFGPFAEWLDRNGYTIYSGDHYDVRDEAEVKDAQDRMGVPDDGLVNATTWGTAFAATHASYSDAIYLPIAWDKRVEPYLYTPDGHLLGKNPDYDPSIPRREGFLNFGENIHRADVIAAGRQIVARSKKRSLVGTIKTPADPEECSFRDMRGGRTLAVPYLDGSGDEGVKFHVTRVEITEDEDGGFAELEVDALWRDRWTVTQIIERNREARHSPGRMRKQNASNISQDTKAVFDRDAGGAGRIRQHQLDAGEWRVVPIPAGSWGAFVRIHMETDPVSEFALVLFARKVTTNFCTRYIGNPLDSDHPYKPNASILKDAGLIQAWGSKSQPAGYSKNGAADGYKSDDDDPTGIFEWDSTLNWYSVRPPIIYLAEYALIDTELKGRFYEQPVEF